MTEATQVHASPSPRSSRERPEATSSSAEVGAARAEVAISNEARERASQRAQDAQASRGREAPGGPSVLAVRFGPAPVTPATERLREAAEVSRGPLPTVAPVLSTPASATSSADAEASAEPASAAGARDISPPAAPPVLGAESDAAPAGRELSLPGSGDRVSPPGSGRAARPEGDVRPLPLPGSGAGRAQDAPPPPEIGLGQRSAAERSEQQQPVSTGEVERAATFATAAAAPQGLANHREPEPRLDLLGAPDEPVGSAIARSALTQVGVVEAQRADDPIARYLAGSPELETGPEPRPRETLGVRSQPLSYYT